MWKMKLSLNEGIMYEAYFVDLAPLLCAFGAPISSEVSVSSNVLVSTDPSISTEVAV